MSRPLHIKNARIWQRDEQYNTSHASDGDLFVHKGRIVAQKPNNALEVDLEGYTVYPALVNAHDHLDLNHYPRTKFREVYANAHQWGEDVNARLNDDPYRTLRNYPIWDQLLIGGIKNLLCGALTVIHHGAKYREMFRRDFPVRVLRHYGWSHSLHFDSDHDIQRSYQRTPKDTPWFIHLAEGTDEVARGEYQRLKKLGCVGENTVIVHGVGMTPEDIADAAPIIRGVVWCPSTNQYLLGATIHARRWIYAGIDVAIGSDSRLTADGDLHQEVKVARRNAVDTNILDEATAPRAAKIAGIPGVGNLDRDSYADIQLSMPQSGLGRDAIGLILREGMPQIGEPDLMAQFPHVQTVACTVDGIEKRMHIRLARQVHRCRLKEAGLEVDALPQGKRFWFF